MIGNIEGIIWLLETLRFVAGRRWQSWGEVALICVMHDGCRTVFASMWVTEEALRDLDPICFKIFEEELEFRCVAELRGS